LKIAADVDLGVALIDERQEAAALPRGRVRSAASSHGWVGSAELTETRLNQEPSGATARWRASGTGMSTEGSASVHWSKPVFSTLRKPKRIQTDTGGTGSGTLTDLILQETKLRAVTPGRWTSFHISDLRDDLSI
jgi:hypothetical protein